MIGIGLGIPRKPGSGGGASATVITWDFSGDPSAIYQDAAGTTPAGDSDPIGLIDTEDYPMAQTDATEKPVLSVDADPSNNCAVYTNDDEQLLNAEAAALLDDVLVDGGEFRVIMTYELSATDSARSPVICSIGAASGNGRLSFQDLNNQRFRVQLRNASNSNVWGFDFTEVVLTRENRYTVSLHFHEGVLDYRVNGVLVSSNTPAPLSGVDWTAGTITMSGLNINGASSGGMSAGDMLYALQVVI